MRPSRARARARCSRDAPGSASLRDASGSSSGAFGTGLSMCPAPSFPLPCSRRVAGTGVHLRDVRLRLCRHVHLRHHTHAHACRHVRHMHTCARGLAPDAPHTHRTRTLASAHARSRLSASGHVLMQREPKRMCWHETPSLNPPPSPCLDPHAPPPHTTTTAPVKNEVAARCPPVSTDRVKEMQRLASAWGAANGLLVRRPTGRR